MSDDALRALRDMVREREETLTFADLSAPLLEDLALGWHKGASFAAHAAELLSRVDGISAAGRDRELAGRALLTLLARRRAGVVPKTPGDRVRLLGSPEEDTGDAEAIQAWDRREAEYASLSGMTPEYPAEHFAADVAGAFASARARVVAELPPDSIGPEHPLALLGMKLPPGLRSWFHERYLAEGASGADARAWKFVLASRALARHRENLTQAGLLAEQGTGIPEKLLAAVLATDLGELARTSVLGIED